MTNVVKFPALTPDPVAYVVGNVLDEEAVEGFVAGLPAESVVAFCLGAEQVKRQAAMAQRMAESRIVGEQILGGGQVWTAPDSREFMWTGERHREVPDPAGLKAALAPIVARAGELARRAYGAAFKPQPDKTYLTELDKIARFSDDAEQTIRSFVTWKEGPPHLRPVEEKPR
jgi:hypothetical protein